MGEILFRGRRIDNGEWVYGNVEFHLVDGDLTKTEQKAFITFDSMDSIGKVYRDTFEVILETVGQYTGLKDKNEVKIFEDDIVEYNSIKALIIKGFCGFEFEWIDGHTDKIRQRKSEPMFHNTSIIFTVIENKHQNPELIKMK
jgi:uncharacterized phage protein (TIGR01671 family)